ncbi:hypothetical protein [Alteromonas australica]|uniref:Uncharacterized protein n=1 Tax=Alteromonas australica TaxID=589873 RepID=A0A075NVH8_9ALTE|nr:hypothetical protein [Alteromonas australica]AIF98654.1 hypothetical protein EP13_08145 [Alteromonas australica]
MIDLKQLLQNKISSVDELVQTILRAFGLVNFKHVTDILNFKKHQNGDVLTSGLTRWVVSTEPSPFIVNNGLYLKAIGDVFVEDFNDGDLSQSEYVQLANKYCMAASSRNRLVFDANVVYEFSSNTSFDIYVESGGWYCSGTCKLHWKSAPKAGYAVKILGRFKYGHHYASLVNNSNYHPLEGFNIGSYNNMLAGIGLCIGHSESLRSMNGAVVTSKFTIARVSVFDFDDVVSFYPGVWACELRQVNTMGGSWQTPFYFNGIDFGESIKLTNCFIADNHRRVADNELGKVNFNTGEFIIYGSSFNNMRVVINGDAVVKMNCPHFENPQSTAKNKRFLEVIGSHAYCVLDKPQIVIRDTPIYSTLFYCKAGSSKNKHPYAGGLVFISPSYNAAPNYRPDLAAYQDDGIEYESDGYLELVGGGGRVYLEGGAHINSLFYREVATPISRNLVNRSLKNYSFNDETLSLNWNNITGSVRLNESENKVNKKIVLMEVGGVELESASISQNLTCAGMQLIVGYGKYQVLSSYTSGLVQVCITTVNRSQIFEVTKNKSVGNSFQEAYSSIEQENWHFIPIVSSVPHGEELLDIELKVSSVNGDRFKVVWDAIIINTL